MTPGWISVFIFFGMMNGYIALRYMQIHFVSYHLQKQMIYFIVHGALLLNALFYFYQFFTGKMQSPYRRYQAIVAGFYLTFLHYAFIFSVIYDFVLKSLIEPTYVYVDLWIFILAFAISFYGYVNGRKLKMTRYPLTLPLKSSSLSQLKVLFISDMHFGVSWNVKRIQDFVEAMNRLDLDLVLLGGDFFDEGSPELEKRQAAHHLSQIRSRYGSFYIEGNHEYKSENVSIQKQLDTIRHAGITVLEDEAVLIDESFYLVGRKDDEGSRKPLASILDDIQENYPVLMLDHRPHHKEALHSRMVDLQLSGHTHAGQFLPFGLMNRFLARYVYSYVYGLYQKDLFKL